MSIGQIIRQIFPPLLVDAYRFCRNGFKGFYVWKGVYEKYKEVPVTGDSYFSVALAQETEQYTRSLVRALEQQKRLPHHINEENSFLPLVVSLIMAEKRKITILDLGGGMGIGFISILSCLEKADSLDHLNYYVIETPNMCKAGAALFKDDRRIRFFSDFPADLENIDIIYLNSSLQYFENYKGILRNLASYKAEYFLFMKFSAGEIPTYATAQQNLKGTTSAYWFFNIEEILSLMLSLGYQLKYKSTLSRVYNQSNFPLEYRLGKASNLLFQKL